MWARLAVCGVLCLSLLTGVAGAQPAVDDAPVAAQHNVSNSQLPPLLTLPENRTRRASAPAPTVSVSQTLAMDAVRFEGAHTNRTLWIRLRSATSDAERFALLERELATMAAETRALQRRERAIIRSYHAGKRSPTATLVALTVVSLRAQSLAQRADTIARAGDQIINSEAIRSGAAIALDRLSVFESPVRSRTVSLYESQLVASPVATVATNDSLVVATTTERRHLREALRTDRRRSSGPGIGVPRAIERFTSAYPAAFDNSSSIAIGGQRQAGVHSVRVTLNDRTRIVSHLDSRSEAIFKETRTQPLSAAATGPSIVATNDSLRLVVNRTYGGGPLRIRLLDTEGDPVVGTVTVGDRTVGRTDADGLWTTAPFRRVTVRATTASGTVAVTHRPIPPRSLGTQNRSVG
jgi:hypothetical protein